MNNVWKVDNCMDTFQLENLKVTDNVEDVGVIRMVILKLTLMK
jgi:hypothetical protein